MLYYFILGRNPTLSIAEIANLRELGDKHQWSTCCLSDEVLILKTKEKIDHQKLQRKLGGIIKIGYIIAQTGIDLTEINPDLFLNELPTSGKIFFGFSLYKLNQKLKIVCLPVRQGNWKLSVKGGSVSGKKIKELALKIKKELKEKGLSSRWVESKEEALSSVIVQKNKLLTSGAEFVFLISEKGFYLGKTLSCQQFEEYEFYDFTRPKRKIEEGMLPPKLVKIMINLAQVSERGIILDPFCGSGTILQEAVLMGYQNLIGTDISQEAIKNTQENIEWLLKSSKLKIQSPKPQVKIQSLDVRNLSEKIPLNSVDAIVTEPYLGPLKIRNLKSEIRKIIERLNNLYLGAFSEFKKILKKEGKIVIIFPLFRINGKLHFLPILEDLKKSGWQIINPIPPELQKSPVIKNTPRGSIIYSRPDQFVLREIFVFHYENNKN